MLTVGAIENKIEKAVPLNATLSTFADNVGLIVGDRNTQVNLAICCLDLTDEVVAEAIERNAQLIITHHPAIFTPLKSITADLTNTRPILTAMRNNIAVYSMHTNLDYIHGGINDYAIEQFSVTRALPLEEVNGVKVGRVGRLRTPMSLSELKQLAERIYSERNIPVIVGHKTAAPNAQNITVSATRPSASVAARESTLTKQSELLSTNSIAVKSVPKSNSANGKISIIAVANGACDGTHTVDLALKAGADALITSDIKHHIALYCAASGLHVILPTHYASEHLFIPSLAKMLNELFTYGDSQFNRSTRALSDKSSQIRAASVARQTAKTAITQSSRMPQERSSEIKFIISEREKSPIDTDFQGGIQ